MFFDDKRLILVANAEPYQNRIVNGEIRLERVRGGVTAALDPMMQMLKQSLWIA